MSTTPDAETKLSYEQARDQLVEVVRQLESGNVPLSAAMELGEGGAHRVATAEAVHVASFSSGEARW